MSEHRVSLQPALILHQRPFSDSSAIVELFTRDYGRVGVLAKGVKRKNSKWRASLQAFQLLQVSWSGKGELPGLTGVEACGRAYLFSGESLFSALYLNELLVRLLPRYDAHEQLFSQYMQALDCLHQPPSLSLCLRKFELHLLTALGYETALDALAESGEPIMPDEHYRFVPGVGIMPAGSARDGLKGSYLIAIHQENLSDPEVLKTARWITRLALNHLLGGKPLQTRALFKAFKKQGVTNPAEDQTADRTS